MLRGVRDDAAARFREWCIEMGSPACSSGAPAGALGQNEIFSRIGAPLPQLP